MKNVHSINIEDEVFEKANKLAGDKKWSFSLFAGEALSEKIARELERENDIISKHG